MDYEIVTLTDGRRGYFYTSRFVGNRIFQPVGEDNCADGDPELVDEEHEVGREAFKVPATAYPWVKLWISGERPR